MQEPCAGGVALVGEGLDVGEAGVVVDRDVQEVVAPIPRPADGFVAPVQAPPAALGHPAELLDIDMEQLTGAATFITRSAPSPADRLAGDRVDRRQRRNLMAGQDPPDGGGDQPELAGQEHRTAVALAAKLEDLGLARCWCAAGWSADARSGLRARPAPRPRSGRSTSRRCRARPRAARRCEPGASLLGGARRSGGGRRRSGGHYGAAPRASGGAGGCVRHTHPASEALLDQPDTPPHTTSRVTTARTRAGPRPGRTRSRRGVSHHGGAPLVASRRRC